MLNLFIVHLFGLLSPGPDFFYVAKMSAGHPRGSAVAAVCGITLGVFFWATSAILGLSFLFITYPALQSIVMMLGGGYLMYLGFLMLRSRHNVKFESSKEMRSSHTSHFFREMLKGLFINLANAKVVIYFSSVMSFVLVDFRETWQILSALFIIVIETFLYFYFISFLFSRSAIKQFYTHYSHYLDNIGGVIFFGFGIYLIYSGILLEINYLA